MQTLLTGDCLELMKDISDNTIDCVITSPPYNLNIKYDTYSDNKTHKDYFDWISDVSKSIFRILKPNGHMFLQLGGTNKNPRLPHEILSRFLSEPDWHLQNEIVWVKSISVDGPCKGHVKPINSNRFLNMAHEYVFHITKQGNVSIDRLAIGIPYADKSNLGRFGASGRVDKRCAGSVWFIPYDTIKNRAEYRKGHPAVFPLELPKRCLRMTGLKSGLVLDPFVGTGTTLVAAKELGLDGIGVDVSKDYVNFALTRC